MLDMSERDRETAKRLLRAGWSELRPNCVITTLNVIESAAVDAVVAALGQARAEERERWSELVGRYARHDSDCQWQPMDTTCRCGFQQALARADRTTGGA